MILSVAAFLIGIVAVQHLAVLPDARQLAVLISVAAALAWRKSRRLTLFVSGMLYAVAVASLQMGDILPESLQGRELRIQGIVDDLPQREDNRIRFDFVVGQAPVGVPKKVRLSWYFPQAEVKGGQSWRLTVKLKRPHGLLNPGGFDYERWLFGNRIGAVGYVRDRPAPELMQTADYAHPLAQWRQAIAERLQRTLPDSRYLGIVKALTIGDRSEMTAAEWDVFRRTGTAHLVAISGLHVGLVAGLVYFLVVKLWAYSGVLSVSPQRVGAVCALLAAFSYSALAGFALPTRRALIMLSIALLAIYRQRHVAPLKILAGALVAVILLDPLAVLSASFWLSFTAVLLIVYTMSARLGGSGYWRSLIKLHWVTALGLAPLIMFYFQQVSAIAPLANLIAVPVIAWLVVPLSLSAIALLFVWPAMAEPILRAVESILHLLWRLLSTCAELPFASLNTAQPPLYAVLLAMAGIFLMLAPKGIAGRYLGLMLCMPLGFARLERPAEGEIKAVLLDVGQGLAAVVETRTHVLVYDTGAKYSRQFDMGQAAVLPYLRFRGVSRIDKLMISHGDNDHSGGMRSIMEAMPVGELIGNPPPGDDSADAVSCRSGQRWEWDGVGFVLLGPPDSLVFQQENNNSCVLKILTARHSLLLPGDIERPAEHWLADRYGDALASDILVAPHHGSNTSSNRGFLEAVDPEVVLLSTGYRNRFGLPHRQVLQRYWEIEIVPLNTAEEGAILIDTEGERLSLQSARQKYGSYWQAR